MKKLITLSVALVAVLVSARPAYNVNTNYGHWVDGAVEFAPKFLDVGHIVNGVVYPHPVWSPSGTASNYLALGWSQIDYTPPAPRDGYEAMVDGFEFTNGVIRLKAVYTPIPPRNLQLSKMRLKQQLRNLGAWDDIWTFISADEDVLQDWNDSVVLDEQNSVVQGAFRALKQMLSDEQIEFVITNSVTEIEVRQ